MNTTMLRNRLFNTKSGICYPGMDVAEVALLKEARRGVQGTFTYEDYGYKQVNGTYMNYWVFADWDGPMPWEETERECRRIRKGR